MTVQTDNTARGRRPHPWATRLRRRVKLPLLRARHAPVQAARGSMVGLIWAFTPTFGLRMPLVLLTWVIARRVFGWEFNLLLGIAWTWTTNALVTVPVYYTFYVTGQIMLGRWHVLSGFDSFEALWAPLLQGDLTQILKLLLAWGLVLWLGALPWAVLMGYLGYHYTHRLLRGRRVLR